jgi:CheY-like chemotaxis protein
VDVYGVFAGELVVGEGAGAGKKWVKRGRKRRGGPTLLDVDDTRGRILVVDDNKVIRQLIRVTLELEGFDVVTAADGAECLDVVRSVRPDVITLDVVMPKIDGIVTAKRLRADPTTRHLPIVIVSAGNRPETVAVDAFLAKPFEPAELVRVVRRLMAARPLRDPGLLRPPGPQPPHSSVR